MKEIKFVDGIRAYKPNQKAPDYVIANFTVNIEELREWVSKQTEDLRLDLMESKSLTYYLKVNDFTPDSSKRRPDEKPLGNNGPAPSRGFDNPPSDDFDDDVPF